MDTHKSVDASSIFQSIAESEERVAALSASWFLLPVHEWFLKSFRQAST